MNPATPPAWRRVPADEAATLIRRLRQANLPLALFDTRDRASYERGHIAGARFLSDAGFGAAMTSLPRSTPVVLYCFRGNASQTWAGMFADFRYAEVYSVDGGHDALAAALARLEGAGQPNAALSPALHTFLAANAYPADDLDAAGQVHAGGLTPLMLAAWRGELALLQELLALGTDVNRRNADGNTALWLACVANSADCVRALHQAGIALDNRNDTGATALMYCASSGKHEMLALLLALGADPLLRNFDDARAADLCATVECLRLLRHTAD